LLILGLAACGGSLLRKVSYLDGYPALAGSGLVNVVVEIPAGTNEKWEVDKTSGALRWEQNAGIHRVIQYLPYPANYGMIPRTSLPRELGGDGDPLDVLLLGPRVDRGTLVEARPIGVLRLLDDGDRDDKILGVGTSGPLSDVVDLESFDSRFPGARLILETWFANYKGPGRVTSGGFDDAAAAMDMVLEASQYYEVHAERTE
jgi:inorganic pyrophosphatase